MGMGRRKAKIQVLFVHGGMTFKNRRDYLDYLRHRSVSLEAKRYYSNWLAERLEPQFQVILPRMPRQENARYHEWKIWFERYLEQMSGPIMLIGSSLGGIFLAKYLAENKIKKKLIALYLVCPPYDHRILGEDLVGGFRLPGDLSLLSKSCPRIRFFFSQDDEIVSLYHATQYARRLPDAAMFVFNDKNGHFRISEFPELEQMIRHDARAGGK